MAFMINTVFILVDYVKQHCVVIFIKINKCIPVATGPERCKSCQSSKSVHHDQIINKYEYIWLTVSQPAIPLIWLLGCPFIRVPPCMIKDKHCQSESTQFSETASLKNSENLFIMQLVKFVRLKRAFLWWYRCDNCSSHKMRSTFYWNNWRNSEGDNQSNSAPKMNTVWTDAAFRTIQMQSLIQVDCVRCDIAAVDWSFMLCKLQGLIALARTHTHTQGMRRCGKYSPATFAMLICLSNSNSYITSKLRTIFIAHESRPLASPCRSCSTAFEELHRI